MPFDFQHRGVLAFAAVLASGVVLAVTEVTAGADLNTRIESRTDRASALKSAIASETRRIRTSAPALAAAQRRFAALNADNVKARARLDGIQHDLRLTRSRLTRLIGRQRVATAALEANLDAAYRSGRPDLVSVLVSVDGFAQLLEQVDFFKRIARRNARVMDGARTAKVAVGRQALRLSQLQARERRAAMLIQRRTDRARVLRTALLRAQQRRLRARSGNAASLRDIQTELAKLRRKLTRSAQNGIRLNPGGVAQAPSGAPPAVGLVIAAGNAIAGLPYLYGGGHAGFKDTAYDCSGSISYALAAAGLVSSPMASGGFMSWGESGPGKWITIYTNPGHMFMVVGDWRYDTTALRSGGSRWTRQMRPTTGFTARHPPGL